MTKPKLRIGLIGSGFMGKAHAFGYATAARVFDLPYEPELHTLADINNDAAAKAVDWLKTFGTSQVVPTAVISGVFKVNNLIQAQDAGLTLFWAHDLKKLGKFITSTGTT